MQNARLVANAERYYRIIYYGSRDSWNLRDSHMFTTLEALLTFHGADSKAIVWAHNSHIGDAGATEMSARGEHNIGHLCRKEFGEQAYLFGFGTNSGTVAAASEWGGPMEVKTVRRRFRKVTSSCGMRLAWHAFYWVCATAATCVVQRASESRGWSARSASSTGLSLNLPASTSKPCCRSNSTNTSGSMMPAR